MYYLVRARLRESRAAQLHTRLVAGELDTMRPFGRALTKALRNARYDPSTGEAVWLEEDSRSPPLPREQAELFDEFFHSVEDEPVSRAEGRAILDSLPPLWDSVLPVGDENF